MPSRPLTVLQLVPALDAGGAERTTIEVAQALVRAGHRALVLSAGGRWVTALEREGAEHVEMPVGAKRFSTLALVPTIVRLVEARGVDIVHARSRLPGWLGWLACRRARRARFVTTVHGLNSPGFYSGVMARGERVICVSETVRRHVLRHWPRTPPERLRVIPRGYDPARYTRASRSADDAASISREFPLLGERPWFLLPARGTRLKGHGEALQALARLRIRHGIDAALLCAGAVESGREAYLDELRQRAAGLGVADRVIFAASRDDLPRLYAHATAVVQPSTRPESFGRVVVEALACGTPVAGFAHGGVGELLAECFPEGAVPPCDVDALAAKLAAFVAASPVVPPLRGYTIDALQRATLAVYAELAG